ncbi:MAG: glycosyltransferase family 4 protein, partial [Candidatus Omnitrophica bacterium]|nr:glycosyltransferase family 4 protein [Candidatus Omnitrophota bacterium]
VHILTRRLSTHTADYSQIEGVHEWRYEINSTNPITFLISTIKNVQKLYSRLTQQIVFDIINFHQPFSALAVNLIRGSSFLPKIYTCHSLSFEELQSRQPEKRLFYKPLFWLNIYLRKLIENFSLKKSNHIIVLSQFTKDKLRTAYSIPEKKISLIPGAVNLENFYFAENKIALRQRRGLPEDKFILFTVRNLEPRMGLENFIRAINLLRQQTKDIHCVMGGEGPSRKKIEALVQELNLQDSVTFTGFIPKEDLASYYQLADFFVLPTVELEGFGLVTVEALACGLPVLGTPIGGTKEILGQFDQGFLFRDVMPESMAEKILEKCRYYRERPQEYARLSQKCRRFVEENYSWEQNIKKTEELFNELGA